MSSQTQRARILEERIMPLYDILWWIGLVCSLIQSGPLLRARGVPLKDLPRALRLTDRPWYMNRLLDAAIVLDLIASVLWVMQRT